MEFFKKAIGMLAAAAMMSGALANADCTDGTCGETEIAYYDSYGTQALSPAIGLGAIAVVTVAAIAISNTDRGTPASMIDTISESKGWPDWDSASLAGRASNLSSHAGNNNNLTGHTSGHN